MRATVGAISTFAVGSGSYMPELKSGPWAIIEICVSVREKLPWSPLRLTELA